MVKVVAATEPNKESEEKVDDEEKQSLLDDVPLPKLRIVSPSDLPPNYVIPVMFQDLETNKWKSAMVRIPQKETNMDSGIGVKKGETFEAVPISTTTTSNSNSNNSNSNSNIIQTVPRITGRWIVSEFDGTSCCCSNKNDTDFCLLAWFCSPVAWACILEQIYDLQKNQPKSSSSSSKNNKAVHSPRFGFKSIGIISAVILVLTVIQFALSRANQAERRYSASSSYSSSSHHYSSTRPSSARATSSDDDVIEGVNFLLFLILIIFMIYVRRVVRQHYTIQGDNCCCDIFCVWCFSPCSVLQSYRQMRVAHEHPNLGYVSTAPKTKAEVIVV